MAASRFSLVAAAAAVVVVLAALAAGVADASALSYAGTRSGQTSQELLGRIGRGGRKLKSLKVNPGGDYKATCWMPGCLVAAEYTTTDNRTMCGCFECLRGEGHWFVPYNAVDQPPVSKGFTVGECVCAIEYGTYLNKTVIDDGATPTPGVARQWFNKKLVPPVCPRVTKNRRSIAACKCSKCPTVAAKNGTVVQLTSKDSGVIPADCTWPY